MFSVFFLFFSLDIKETVMRNGLFSSVRSLISEVLKGFNWYSFFILLQWALVHHILKARYGEAQMSKPEQCLMYLHCIMYMTLLSADLASFSKLEILRLNMHWSLLGKTEVYTSFSSAYEIILFLAFWQKRHPEHSWIWLMKWILLQSDVYKK